MRSISPCVRIGAALAVFGIAVAACSSTSTSASPGSGGKPSHAPMRSMAPSPASAHVTNTPAARLYAGLDQLLREHADLVANLVQVAVTTGPSSAAAKQSLKTLGQNTDALGTAVGSVYGPAAKREFLQLWRAHIGFFVSYTLGVAGHDKAKVATAQKSLDGYVAKFSKFIAGATSLPEAAVAGDLKGHVSTLEAAINAIIAKSPGAGRAIEMAAMHMDGTAAVLAGGFASSKNIPGNVNGAGSKLRGALTGLFIQHVAATSFVVQTAVASKGNLGNPEVKGAVAALSDNTNQLGTAIGSVYGAAAQREFLQLWRAHIGFFVNYTLGLATHDKAKVAAAQKSLDGYITKFSKFIAGPTKLPVPAVASDLKGHVATLEAAIRAIVSGSLAASNDMVIAENHMAGTAAVLAGGIAASMPTKFKN